MNDIQTQASTATPVWLQWLLPAMTILLFGWLYFPTFEWMYDRFTGPDSYYSHGFFVPLISAYIIWKKRHVLHPLSADFSWMGLAMVLLALLLHMAATVLYIFSLSAISIFFLALGVSLFLLGKRATLVILFPLFFLLFMLPLPTAIINAISLPLKMIVAAIGVKLIQLTSIPVLREGFVITIPAGQLLVGNPCSGLRSLIAFLAIAAVFAHLSACGYLRKTILFLSAIPIALVSNFIRVPILILVSYFWGLEAARPNSVWHTGSGILVFMLGLLMFMLFHRWIECRS